METRRFPTPAVARFERQAGRALALIGGAAGMMVLAALALAAWFCAGDPVQTLGLGVVFSLLAFAALALAARSWLHAQLVAPLADLEAALHAFRAGDLSVRVAPAGASPPALEGLSRTLDAALDEQVRGLADRRAENEVLNDSVVAIMQAVGAMAAQKDLTLRVPVTEDVTGAIADALNLLASELQRVLLAVRSVAGEVAQASAGARAQADLAAQAAGEQHVAVEGAARELADAAQAFSHIAAAALACEDAARDAVQASSESLHGVESSAAAVEQSRVTIHATEKRIKRLGERSQEIGEVVTLIEGIARRTGILALNASMQASAAADAGRGFGVLAEEIKRLSVGAGEAAARIRELVVAIQADTAQAVRAMNEAIAQVVEVSRLSQAAGAGMGRNCEQLAVLARTIEDIVRCSATQSGLGERLLDRSRTIEGASATTVRQLGKQVDRMDRLAQSARRLTRDIGEFRIAGDAPPPKEQP